MNEITIIDVPAEGVLETIERTDLATILANPGATDTLLERIATDARARAAILDISTKKGRDGIASLRRTKLGGAKSQITAAVNKLTEEWRSQTAAAVANRKKSEAFISALQDEVGAELDKYVAAEAARTIANKNAIDALEALVDGLADLTAAQIKERWRQAGVVAEFPWSVEFAVKAERVQNGVIAQLEVAHARAKQREAEAAAEVVRLAEEAETQRLAAIEAQRVREEQIAREAAEKATQEAEALAARQAEEAAKAAQDALDAAEARAQAERDAAAQREREAEAKAAHDREIAQQVAERAETARVAAHHAAIVIMRKLATPLAPPDPAAVVDAKMDQLADVYERDWQEFAGEADTVCAISRIALTAARAESIRLATERAEKDLADALERERIAVDRAEITRKAEVAKVEREKLAAIEAATLAEQRRAAEMKAEEDRQTEARAKNREHKAKINGEVLADLMKVLASVAPLVAGGAEAPMEGIAKSIVVALATRAIRHCRVDY
jgi:hypothetical protein